MVKINLLDISEDNVIFEKGSDLTASKPIKEEREFSLESVNELFQSSQTSKQTEPQKIVKEEQKPALEKTTVDTSYNQQEDFKSSMDEEESFDHISKRKMFFFSFIFIILIAAALIYFFVIRQNGEETSPQIAETSTQELTQDNSQIQSTPKVGQEVLNIFSQNRANNNYGLNLIQKLTNTAKGDISFALLVISPNQVQFSIIADSRNSLASYQNNIKSQFPGTNIRLVNSEDMIVSGQSKILADFSFTITGPDDSPPVTNFQTIKPNGIKSMLNSLAQKHRLNLQYFKEGRKVPVNEVNQIKYYCTLIGNSETLLKYIKEISDTYPAISFSKIAFNPSNLGTVGKGQFTARITMILNESRTS